MTLAHSKGGCVCSLSARRSPFAISSDLSTFGGQVSSKLKSAIVRRILNDTANSDQDVGNRWTAISPYAFYPQLPPTNSKRKHALVEALPEKSSTITLRNHSSSTARHSQGVWAWWIDSSHKGRRQTPKPLEWSLHTTIREHRTPSTKCRPTVRE